MSGLSLHMQRKKSFLIFCYRVFDPLLRTHPHISERIRNIEALDDEKVIETPMLKAHLTPHKNFK